jgi:uncharacterized membrane protein YphA (DoxX/SURF4 family)
MPLFLLNPWVLGGATVFLTGAFAGSQLDDALDSPQGGTNKDYGFNAQTLILVGGFLLVFILGKKALSDVL